MSRNELAEAVCAWLWHTQGRHAELDGAYIAKLERDAVRRPGMDYREALRAVLTAATDRDIGLLPDGSGR
ncbi:hypothetical protein [Kribbella sp. NPDC055071]